MPVRSKSPARTPEKNKSLEQWIWDAACSIRGAKDAPQYKDFILPLIFTKRLCDVFDDDRLSNLIEKISEKRLGLEFKDTIIRDPHPALHAQIA